MNCTDCKDTGVIHLLTSTVPCKCREARPEPESVCFGSINGVTLQGDPALHRDRAMTYTLEVDVGGEISTFVGLSQSAVDFVHACLKSGWTAERVRNHLNEMATAEKVNERQRHLADLEAAGYPEHEIKAMAERIEERLFTVDDDGEAVKIIMEEVSGLILRKVIRGALECLIPNVQEMPKGKATFAKGGVVSGERFRQQCGFSFVQESCFGVNPGAEIRSDRQLHKSIRVGMPTGCGKAELLKRLYGGKPDPSIDTSQIELRMLAHLKENTSERFNNYSNFGGFPHVPRPPSSAPDAG